MKKLIGLFILMVFGLRAQLPNTLSVDEKIYGLSKFWKEVSYNFVFFDQIGMRKWDSIYKEFIPIVSKTTNDYQYFHELERFCALLKDGHTNVYLPEKKEYEKMNTMFGDYRIFLENIEGRAIVVRTNLSKKDEIPVGSEIIEVNGLTTKEYIGKYVSPYISSSTDHVLMDWSLGRMLMGFSGDSYSVKIKRPKGDIISLKLTHGQTKEKEVFPSFDEGKQLLDFKWMENNIAYVSLNGFSDPKIDSLFIAKLPELYKGKGLIIDLRWNPGGSTNVGKVIIDYLTNDKVLYGSRSSTRQHMPSYKAWGDGLTAKDTIGDRSGETKKSFLCNNDSYVHYFEYSPDSVDLSTKKIVVPTAILIGHNTASAAEDFLIYADNQKHMTKIGENTFGSTGQPYRFDLVGGGTARVCTKNDTYPDGKKFIGVGVKPDIEVKKTVKDYLEKKDPVLDKAVSYLKGKVK